MSVFKRPKQINISAKIYSSEKVLTAGTYTFQESNINWQSYCAYAIQVMPGGAQVKTFPITGVLTITSVDLNNKTATGTINFVGNNVSDSTVVNLKNGIFNKIAFNSKFTKF